MGFLVQTSRPGVDPQLVEFEHVPPLIRDCGSAPDHRIDVKVLVVRRPDVSATDALKEYARSRSASAVVLGMPRARGAWRRMARSMPAALFASGIDADLILIARRDRDAADIREARPVNSRDFSSRQLIPYAYALALAALRGYAPGFYTVFTPQTSNSTHFLLAKPQRRWPAESERS